MKKLACLLVFLFIGTANATLINFTGEIEYHNDVIYTAFTVGDDATNVRLWTDSYQNGLNFDPITALWDSAGNLIQESDDNQNINSTTQTRYDSGFELANLVAGDYLFTVATYNNFAAGSNISDGFSFDSQAPITLGLWNQPANGLNRGTNWSVWLDGVDSANQPYNSVPEPASIALFALGIAGIGFYRRKKTT